MTRNIKGLILLGLLVVCCGCATHNVTNALPGNEEGTSASATPSDTPLETYYWSGEASPSPDAR